MTDAHSQEIYNLVAEQSVIGALLIRPELIDTITCDLVADDFFFSEHKAIFQAILGVRKKNVPIDVISVAEELGLLTFSSGETTNPLVYLADIARNTPSVANAKAYADMVRERSVCRSIEQIGMQARDIARSKQPLADKIAAIQKLALDLDSATNTTDVVHASDVLRVHVEEIQRRFDLGGQIDGLSTGNKTLDDYLCGLKGGELAVIAARPSMGKTAFAMNIASHNAIHANKSVLVISLEMTNGSIMDRLIASVGEIDLGELKTGKIQEDSWPKFTCAADLINKSKLHLSDRTSININQLRSIARRHKFKHGLDLLIVDYLQLLQGTGNDTRVNEVSDMSRQCKLIARELDIPVIILSQLNRALEQRNNKRPIMSDLRESGAIEQDADLIMFLYRDSFYNKDGDTPSDLAEVIISKFRNGEPSTLYTKFIGKQSRFVALNSEEIPSYTKPSYTSTFTKDYINKVSKKGKC